VVEFLQRSNSSTYEVHCPWQDPVILLLFVQELLVMQRQNQLPASASASATCATTSGLHMCLRSLTIVCIADFDRKFVKQEKDGCCSRLLIYPDVQHVYVVFCLRIAVCAM
jgi:hypothetical protein